MQRATATGETLDLARTSAPTTPPHAATTASPHQAAPTVQTALDAAPVVAPATTADVVGPTASPFASATAADLDELARRLTEPLLRRVRGQLLVDRERRGTRVDL